MSKNNSDSNRLTPDRKVFERALSHYLQPAPPPSLATHQDLSFEDALAQICDLLRCAAATATETLLGLTGDQRHMAGATAHLIDMARTLADRALDCVQPTA
ncbi:DUF6124 family protein [Pseudomonas sp. AMR01]|uniref:DUF6124 family protein n=1 Tax=Pseudomonas sp. AMR01 TaxID=3064904 RepID=UPI0035C1414A